MAALLEFLTQFPHIVTFEDAPSPHSAPASEAFPSPHSAPATSERRSQNRFFSALETQDLFRRGDPSGGGLEKELCSVFDSGFVCTKIIVQ
jgi:hypothetical protein